MADWVDRVNENIRARRTAQTTGLPAGYEINPEMGITGEQFMDHALRASRGGLTDEQMMAVAMRNGAVRRAQGSAVDRATAATARSTGGMSMTPLTPMPPGQPQVPFDPQSLPSMPSPTGSTLFTAPTAADIAKRTAASNPYPTTAYGAGAGIRSTVGDYFKRAATQDVVGAAPIRSFFSGLFGGSAPVGGGQGTLEQRGYPGADASALEHVTAARGINYLPDDEVARENAGMLGKQNTWQTGGYAAPGATPSIPAGNVYGDDAAFGFRNRLQNNRTNPATPGEQLQMTYGPGFGNTKVNVTADASGRFNQFSGSTPTPAGGSGVSDPYGVGAQVALLRQRAGYFGSKPDMYSKMVAAKAHLAANSMLANAAQFAEIGVRNRGVDVEQQRANTADRYQTMQENISGPSIAREQRQNYQLFGPNPNPNAVAEQEAARRGQPYVKAYVGTGGTRVVPAGTTGNIPGYPAVEGMPSMNFPPIQPLQYTSPYDDPLNRPYATGISGR